MSLAGRAHDLLAALRWSREDLDARDEAASASARGTVPIGDLTPRSPARGSGVLRAVTYRPATAKPVLVGQLFDGTGSVDLVWIGRRSIAGVTPGRHLIASGTVVAGRARPVIYNPAYELLVPGA